MKNLRFILASFWVVMGLFVATTAFAKNNDIVTETARKHFRAGVSYIDDPTGPKYEEAYREFHKAFAESPVYKILSNIGLCALNLERDGEAIDAYQRFLAEAKSEDIPADKRKLMERDIAMLKASLVTLDLSGVPESMTLTDERLTSKGSAVVNRYELTKGKLTLGIHPGHHKITATAEGFEPLTWDFEADSATTHRHVFELKPIVTPSTNDAKKTSTIVVAPLETQKTRQTPKLVYVGAIATGVFAIGATVTGLIASSKKTDFEKANTGSNPQKAEDLRESGKTFALMTDIGIGASVLSAIGTAVVYFTAPSVESDSKLSRARLRFYPDVSPTQTSIWVSGQF
jgi:hypothetical protein